MDVTAAELAALPKAELHCHLDGVPDPALLRQLRDVGVELPVSPEALEAVPPVRDFKSFLGWFGAQQPVKDQFSFYRHVARIHVERLKAQHVVYAELYVASLPTDVERARDELTALRSEIDAIEDGRIQVELVACWGRNRGLERAEANATRTIRLFEVGLLCGTAVAGPEEGYPIAPLARVMDRYHEAGVPIQIHAAEWCGPESAWDALQHGHPRRLGHATHVFDDPRLVETLLERQIHLEMCPTSNMLTASIARIEDHPIRRAFDLGLNVGVNTDDPGAFGCSMTSEHALLAEQFGFTPNELRRLTANAIAARFSPTLRVALPS
jgi:adenosine deaminase